MAEEIKTVEELKEIRNWKLKENDSFRNSGVKLDLTLKNGIEITIELTEEQWAIIQERISNG